MKCWVCKRQARGFGHTDNRHGVGDPRRYPIDWVFCSRRCQNAFHALYGNWLRVKEGCLDIKEVAMIDPSDVELAAMKKCLKAFGEAAGEIGFAKPLGDYSEAQALQVVDAIVTCWTDVMVEHHEVSKHPPVRGMKPTPDPLANPFADLEDELPWETIVALNFDSPEDEARYIAATCRALRGIAVKDDGTERGISWSDMAILLRSVRRDGSPIMEALDAAGIPYVITGMDNLFAKPESEAARQLFFFLAGRATKEDLRSAWLVADLGIAPIALDRAIAAADQARINMRNAEAGQFKVYNLQRQFMAFLERIGLREEGVPGGRGEIVFYNLGKFSQAISDFESIHFHSNPTDKYESFAGFLEYHAEHAYPEGWQDNGFVSPDAVRIMTVHQAKGLQWPAVFIPQLVRNRFPAKGGGGRTAWHLLPATALRSGKRTGVTRSRCIDSSRRCSTLRTASLTSTSRRSRVD